VYELSRSYLEECSFPPSNAEKAEKIKRDGRKKRGDSGPILFLFRSKVIAIRLIVVPVTFLFFFFFSLMTAVSVAERSKQSVELATS